jgi:hypothetical protein
MLGAWREAEAAADQAVRHAELAGDAEMLALALMGGVELEVERGDLPLADGRLARAAALAREADASAWRVQALDRLGRLGAMGHTARFEQEWRTPA